jgi:hypothetical protein
LNGNHKFYNWLIILFFAFYSSLILSGIFVLVVLGLVFVYDVVKQKRVNTFYLFALAFFSISYLLSHFPVIHSFLFSDGFVSHRVEFVQPTKNLATSIQSSLKIFLFGQYHAHSLHSFMIIPILGLFFIRSFRQSVSKIYKYLLWFIGLTSILYGFLEFETISPLVRSVMKVIPLQFQRFHFLHPFFWYILLAIALTYIFSNLKYGKQIVYLLIGFQLLVVIANHDGFRQKRKPTFKEFYSESAFTAVKKAIVKPMESYRVISVGMHPAIAQYNGFYTLDAYLPNYSLDYKHEFKKAVESEINRDPEVENYFNNWGSRCYAFSSELGRDFLNNKPNPIEQLNYDYDQLYFLGCEYILSSTLINLDKNPKLKLVEIVKGNFWTIHIYRISSKKGSP